MRFFLSNGKELLSLQRKMIDNREQYLYYKKCDLAAHGLQKVSLYNYWWQDCLRFQLRLRRIEYLHNCRHDVLSKAWLFVLEVINHRLATRLGFTIPKNVFGPGLCIVHYGTIVVSPLAKVGAHCRIHPGTSIGDYNGAPQLGDHVYVGPGAKLYGPIQIGNNVAIGANSVVNQSFESNITLAGAPAHVVSKQGARESGVFPCEKK